MVADFSKLDKAFNPHCVAVVGDKKETDFRWLRAQSTFKGKLYSVQVDPKEIEQIKAMGITNYTSLMDIPEPIDLAIVAVPRSVTPRVLEDCINKGVTVAHFYTAGFTETDTDEGKKLESLLVNRAKQADFYLIGPNCLGIFSPMAGIRQAITQYSGVAGPVGFISQSGTHAVTFSQEAHLQGVDVSKLVSFGNGVVLDSSDFLEYYARDDAIKAIGMYLEGIKDGRKFFKVLKEVCVRKPVVIWKGGRTAEGGRAIASHTASLAVPMAIWDAAMKQCGTIKVKSLEEMIDTLKAILLLSPVKGNRVVLAGGSGGQSVAVTDVFAEAGLNVPVLTTKSYDEFATFFSLVGGSYRNPIDTGNPNRRFMKRVMEIIEKDENVDNIVMLLWPGRRVAPAGPAPESTDEIASVIEMRKNTAKPVMAIFPAFFVTDTAQQVKDAMQRLQDGGVPAFPTLERGARALKNALDYYTFKNR